jgi:hypothetical protein
MNRTANCPTPWLSVVYCAILPLETIPPPGDPSGGVVYRRIVLSPEEASQLANIT